MPAGVHPTCESGVISGPLADSCHRRCAIDAGCRWNYIDLTCSQERQTCFANAGRRLLFSKCDMQWITIDGSAGEGGGQVLRTALALSLVTGRPFRIERIRARRAKSGLLRQHLTAVQAAADVGRARVSGNALGSDTLSFEPGTIHGGEHRWSVGTAGSATLVLQAVLPALLAAPGAST